MGVGVSDDWRCRATTVGGDPCRSPVKSASNPEFCSRHDPDMDDFWRAASEKGGENRRRIRSTCFLEGCNKALPKGRSKWHSDECANLGRQRDKTEKARLMAGDAKVASQMRRPPKEFYEEGWHLMVGADGAPETQVVKDCAERFVVDRSTVNRWYAYVLQERTDSRRRAGWEPPPRHYPEKWRDLTVADVPAMIADFLWFRAEFFETDDEEPYLIADFHENWIEALMRCWVTRGRLMILSPPRHGKTELLLHLVIWLICRFPNIKVIWIGPTDDIAQDIVGQHVIDQLEQNEKLIETFTPPGSKGFRPSGKGRSWVKSEFTVATRSILQKSPTARFQGRGGTLVSRDANVIICDDIEQDKTVYQPGTREKTRNWASTSLFSRKTKKLAIAFIGSRQHPDDLWAHFLENELFETIVETAHDETCEIPREDPARYGEHVECMLWPEANDFEWLMEMQILNETTGGRETFEMVYLNRAHGTGLTVFDAVEIAACRNRNHRVGAMPDAVVPEGYEGDVGGVSLIAGLDPSGSGFQAAFLWAYQTQPELRMWMIDLENKEGGGIAQARATIEAWDELHGVKHWVVEENLYHGGISSDEILLETRQRLGIYLEPHRTGVEKWDPNLGVSTLRPLFAERKIILPYGDVDSVAKSDLYQRQLVYFSNAPRNRNTRAGYKSDLVMASWFPMVVVRRERMSALAEAGIEYTQSYSWYQRSSMNTAPWGRTRVA